MLQAAAASGPTGYFADLAQSPAYFLAWLALLFGLQALITVAQHRTARRWIQVRAGVFLGLLPETLLTIPVAARAEIGADT